MTNPNRTRWVAGPKGSPPKDAGIYEERGIDAKWISWLPHEVKDKQTGQAKGTMWTPHCEFDGLIDLARREKAIRRQDVEILQLPSNHNGGVCICKATFEFEDGTIYSDIADADKTNVGSGIKDSFIRMASTRAKARVLRDALNIEGASAEEMSDRSQAEQEADHTVVPEESPEDQQRMALLKEINRLTYDVHGARDDTLVELVKEDARKFEQESAKDCTLVQLEEIRNHLADVNGAPIGVDTPTTSTEEMATEQQRVAVTSLCKKVGRDIPDLDYMTKEEATKAIKLMQAMGKKNRPESESASASLYDEGEQKLRLEMQKQLQVIFTEKPHYEETVRDEMRQHYHANSILGDSVPTSALVAWVELGSEPVSESNDGEPKQEQVALT